MGLPLQVWHKIHALLSCSLIPITLALNMIRQKASFTADLHCQGVREGDHAGHTNKAIRECMFDTQETLAGGAKCEQSCAVLVNVDRTGELPLCDAAIAELHTSRPFSHWPGPRSLRVPLSAQECSTHPATMSPIGNGVCLRQDDAMTSCCVTGQRAASRSGGTARSDQGGARRGNSRQAARGGESGGYGRAADGLAKVGGGAEARLGALAG